MPNLFDLSNTVNLAIYNYTVLTIEPDSRSKLVLYSMLFIRLFYGTDIKVNHLHEGQVFCPKAEFFGQI